MALEQLPQKPNIVLIITDQEREVRHWPEGWAEANLPARSRLMAHGLRFTNAYCNSATCSPSRATLLTGLYPARHGVKTLIQYDKPKNRAQGRLPVLPPHLPNLARVLEAEGYHVVYKGKFHLSRPVKYNAFEKRHAWSEADIENMTKTYGFHEWNPPDMGDPTSLSNFGGGSINNDGRFVDGSGTAAGRKVRRDEAYAQSAVGFL
ncbi:MAG: sulfatase-like hydrolase/transferase, partial [Anaerolineae bacterium]